MMKRRNLISTSLVIIGLSGCTGSASDLSTPTPTPTPTEPPNFDNVLSLELANLVDNNSDGNVSEFQLNVEADLSAVNYKDSDGKGEPFLEVRVNERLVFDTDVLSRDKNAMKTFQFGNEQLDRFDTGNLTVEVFLYDEDSLSDDLVTSETITVPYETKSSDYRPAIPDESEVPEHEIVELENVSYGSVTRAVSNVKTERPVSGLSDDEFLIIARDITARGLTEVELNANAVVFWEDSAVVGSGNAFAEVIWAPYGEWDRAGDVETGDYSKHEFSLKRY